MEAITYLGACLHAFSPTYWHCFVGFFKRWLRVRLMASVLASVLYLHIFVLPQLLVAANCVTVIFFSLHVFVDAQSDTVGCSLDCLYCLHCAYILYACCSFVHMVLGRRRFCPAFQFEQCFVYVVPFHRAVFLYLPISPLTWQTFCDVYFWWYLLWAKLEDCGVSMS